MKGQRTAEVILDGPCWHPHKLTALSTCVPPRVLGAMSAAQRMLPPLQAARRHCSRHVFIIGAIIYSPQSGHPTVTNNTASDGYFLRDCHTPGSHTPELLEPM